MTLQETYNYFASTSNVENSEWYQSLKKYSELLQEIRQKAKQNFYNSYNDLNNDYKSLANDSNDDFLDRYIFRKNNGLSEISQQLVTLKRRGEMTAEVNANISFPALNDILKEDDIKKCLTMICEFIDQNKWTVANRFLRALFPTHFTSIDSYNHFELLKRKLKKDFNININTQSVIDKNEQAISLIEFDDIYKAQIFFWMLKSNEISQLSKLSDNTIATNEMKEKFPINQILYGPPGTGKTYHTINKAIEIINPDFDFSQPRTEIKKEFKNLIDGEQIVFTTFHQSMSYEDFIEGIKPETVEDNEGNKHIIYDIKDGLFKQINDKAKNNWLSSMSDDATRLSFDEAFSKLKEEWDEDNRILFPLTREGYDFTILGFTEKSIKFKKSNGGTGHTLSINTLSDLYYEKREESRTGVGIYYPSIIRKLLSYSSDTTKKQDLQNYVLIIDEINRGNVSQIFGELITLIEEDKRLGNAESLEITLPYSKEKFGVSPNLYIIGTMNTADRSVEALDTALRRRFSFEEMPPKPELLKSPSDLIEDLFWDYKEYPWKDKVYEPKEKELFDYLGAPEELWGSRERIWGIMNKDKNNNNLKNGTYFSEFVFKKIDLKKLLITINSRIEKLLDKDHSIGHAYFIGKDDETIIDSFYKNIIPLLQEYFFGDYGKIGLVLGKGFVKLKQNRSSVFADFDYQNDYSERESYEIIDYRNPDLDYQLEGSGIKMDFKKAIMLLMNQPVQ
ncbi:McrB family protein [Chryseobacterium sp. MIQD13]